MHRNWVRHAVVIDSNIYTKAQPFQLQLTNRASYKTCTSSHKKNIPTYISRGQHSECFVIMRVHEERMKSRQNCTRRYSRSRCFMPEKNPRHSLHRRQGLTPGTVWMLRSKQTSLAFAGNINNYMLTWRPLLYTLLMFHVCYTWEILFFFKSFT